MKKCFEILWSRDKFVYMRVMRDNHENRKTSLRVVYRFYLYGIRGWQKKMSSFVLGN